MNNSDNSDEEIYKPRALNIIFKETTTKQVVKLVKIKEPIREINIEDFPSLTPTNKSIDNNLSPNSWLNVAKKITEASTNIFLESSKKQKSEKKKEEKTETIEETDELKKSSDTPKKDKKKVELTEDGWFEVKTKTKINKKKKKDNQELDDLTNEFIRKCTN